MGRKRVGDPLACAGDIRFLDGLDRFLAEVVFGFDVRAVDFDDLEGSTEVTFLAEDVRHDGLVTIHDT